ncbi:MAG: hypothetical protein H8E84_04815 [Flavobacteriales bacterium]|nr:hypothetical protein [Flavobacteriales bacterium]
MKNKFLLISATFLCAFNVNAQDIKATEVRVTEQFIPAIPEASKLNEQATFSDTIKVDKTQKYAISQHSLKADYKTRPLKAAKVKAETIPKLYGSKVSIGFGDNWNTRATIAHNSSRSKTLNYGLLLNHFSNKYKLPLNYTVSGLYPHISNSSYLAQNSKNNMHLYAKKIKGDYIFLANIDYDRRTAVWFPEDINEILKNYRNRFAYTKFSISAISKENTSNKMIRNATFFLSDLNEMSENQIHLSTNLSKTINGFPINLEIELNDYLNYNNSDSRFESADVKSLHFSPSTSITKFGLDFNLGLALLYFTDDTPFEIFPQIKITKELVKDVLLVYGGIRHSQQRHTIKSLSDENPYIHSYGTNQSILGASSNGYLLQDLRTTDTDELYVAMRNVLGKDEVFNGGIACGRVVNFAHFVRNYSPNYNRFSIGYEDVWQLHINANYDKKINNIISLNANADYYNWDKEVYHKPNFTCKLSAPINLRDKIKVAPSLSYMSMRFSMQEFNGVNHVPLPSPDNGVSELPAQFHFNLGLQYNYSKILSAYLQLNNLTNSKKELFSGYQEIGFNGVFGLSYAF